MNGKERVIAAINKEPVDCIPSGFSLHFPKGCESGEKGVGAHLEFFKETDMDICKIMNENLLPNIPNIKTADDWKKVPVFSIKNDFMIRQIDMTKRILDQCDSQKFMMGTLHGIVASCIHPIEKEYGYEGARKIMCLHLRENKQVMLDVFRKMAEGMCELAEKYIEIGLDSVYYAGLGGETYYYTDEEFSNYIAPFDKMILQTINQTKGYCFLHMCKDQLNLKRYESYNKYADVVNWGVHEVPFSLAEGRKLFPETTIMGGLANRSGALVTGSTQDLRLSVKEIINDFGRTGFILGADCTLPTEVDYKRVSVAVAAAREQ